MKDQKVTKVVSTKITEEEYDQLHKLARHYNHKVTLPRPVHLKS